MKRCIACCLLILGLQTMSYAQSRTHVFRHIADGFFPSGWYYTSTIAASPWISFGGATCAVSRYGLEANFGSERASSFTFHMPEDGYWIESTDGRQPIATGYAVMECDDYVNAHSEPRFGGSFYSIGMGSFYVVKRLVHITVKLL